MVKGAVLILVILLFGFLFRQPIQRMMFGSSPNSVQLTQNVVKQTPQATTATLPDVITTNFVSGKGQFFTDATGMTLYTYDEDNKNMSNCTDQCLVNWPPFLETTPSASLTADFGKINKHPDVDQYTWRGKPLYYYIKDIQKGDVNGDGVGGVWHIVLDPDYPPNNSDTGN